MKTSFFLNTRQITRTLGMFFWSALLFLNMNLLAQAQPSGTHKTDTKALESKIDLMEKRLQKLEERYENLLGMTAALETMLRSGKGPRAFREEGTPTAGGPAPSPAPNGWRNSIGQSSPRGGAPGSSAQPGWNSNVATTDTLEEQETVKRPRRRRVGLEDEETASPAPSNGNASKTARVEPATPPITPPFEASTSKELYNKSYSRLLKRDYAAASQGFSAFIQRYPNDRQAGNAQYWLGETHYVQGAYKKAADAFLAGYQKYGTSPKAPNSLLKLAITLAKLGKTRASCSTLGELDRKYPNASRYVAGRAQSEKERLGCP